ncbi:S24 family peptidase [Pseudacidovorax sp. NFM-22]|uniref:S24 family peptidase n=1 Tax=Pseudacidovorax sp. NFM-22 TaxID=2744469 RepID=UPI001F460355|nr:S24 family peptidase [Pseudacidovorax sp. NFM-22]
MTQLFSAPLTKVNSAPHIDEVSNVLNHWRMKTVETIRRERLLELVREHRTAAGLSKLINKAPAQISQWVNQSVDSKSGKPRAMSGAIAREIEAALGKPTGWMDNPDDDLESSSASTPFLPGFQKLAVPLLANSGSMGPGDEDMGEEVMTGALPVSPEWAQRTLKPTGLQNLRFIHGYGDSMKGTFEDGDLLLVDIGVQEPKIDGVYVLEANERVYIKRVRQRMDGVYEISSDNPKVRTVDVLDGSIEVKCRGRVLWAWNGVKL